ncbi:MAG TPA: cytochrome c oxidase subunit 3 [Gaiellaceae bacterium]|nr:cytochrome c oxidase subunit 3 [Gaiellaceae bacterium]
MSQFVSDTPNYAVVEEEPPELSARTMVTGAHLWASATAFFFIDFLFAYFYLRSLNTGGMWRPKHVDASLTLGTLFTACVVAAAVAVWYGLQDERAGRRAAWRLKGAVALGLLVAALGLQIAEWSTQGFGPTDGAYASVYVGWTGMLFLFVIGTLFWLETVLATAIRYRNVPAGGRPPAGHASGDPHRGRHDIADPLSLIDPQLTAVSFYTSFIAVIAVITWIILYLA